MNIQVDNKEHNQTNMLKMQGKTMLTQEQLKASDIGNKSSQSKASDMMNSSNKEDSPNTTTNTSNTTSSSPFSIPHHIQEQTTLVSFSVPNTANRRRSTLNKSKSFVAKKTVSHNQNELETIKNNITIDYYNDGSLDPIVTKCLEDTFAIHHLLKEIDETDNEAKSDFFVGQMAQNYKDKSFFVIPQLCSLVMNKKYNRALSRFILNQCINEMKFSLIASWYISSSAKHEIEAKQRHDAFYSDIEMSLVNGSASENNGLTEEETYVIARDKEFKLNYFNLVKNFYNRLKVMCERLMQYPKEDRNNPENERKFILAKYIKRFNQALREMYNKNGVIMEIKKSTRGFFRGILLPFEDSDTAKNKECNVIVNFLSEHSFCFNTKARVPVKLVFECVKEIDLADWDHYYIEKNISHEVIEENIESDHDEISEQKDTNQNDLIVCQSPKRLNSTDDYNLSPISSPIKSLPNSSQSTKNVIKLTQCIDNNSDESKSHNSIDHTKPFGELWTTLEEETKAKSNYGQFPSYSLKGFIAKANDDLRQELLTMQLIKICNSIFNEAHIPLNLHPYEIVITSDSSGLIEFLPNTLSIDAIKKLPNSDTNLNTFFRQYFADDLPQAQQNFVESLAAYCLITYLIGIKDRHNGNILLDIQGNIIHIDYGFILGISPGRNSGCEYAPFKLTQEYVDIMDGIESSKFECFKTFMALGLTELQKNYMRFEKIIEIAGRTTTLPCFTNQKKTLAQILSDFKGRFHLGNSFDSNLILVHKLIYESFGCRGTKLYDWFQKKTNQIIP